MLTAYPNVTTSVRGHTDDTGDPAANKKLSADRAAAVQQALVARGVPASRITSEGFGAEQPIASNDSEEGRARNRRVELMVVKG
jgi:outer membrane protein OmpA-like peptidoglycan-associated protein